eukprot:TRINITY_DN2682_c0_g5_i1.p1 TRINITY_DN2682_c0_g5~~TRINITY_DN2682_c0_g5_i1.p1  ORF type:complete len:399 (+),score=120.75 TRINITY_DN2682_c0_g5_i1:209-1405(+)
MVGNDVKYGHYGGYAANMSRIFGKDIANFSSSNNTNQENVFAMANKVAVPPIRGYVTREETGEDSMVSDLPRLTKRPSFIGEKFNSYRELTKETNSNPFFVLRREGKQKSEMSEEKVTSRPSAMEEELDQWDVEDLSNIQCVSVYAKDIFKHLKENEEKFVAKYGYIQRVQTDINEKMRAILVDWLVDVHSKFKLLPETLFLCVNIIDRYLDKVQTPRQKLQLVGITSLFIASKYEEIYPPELKDFAYVTDKAYTKVDVLDMEGKIISALQFNLLTISPGRFLDRYSRISRLDSKFFFFTRYMLELCLLDYRMLRYTPSQLACAAVFLANKLCSKNESNEVLLRNASFKDSQIKPCVHEMILLLQANEKSSLQAIRRKYSNTKYCEVSKIRINVVEKK